MSVGAAATLVAVILVGVAGFAGLRGGSSAVTWRVEASGDVAALTVTLQQSQLVAEDWIRPGSTTSFAALLDPVRSADATWSSYQHLMATHGGLTPSGRRVAADIAVLDADPPPLPSPSGPERAQTVAAVTAHGVLVKGATEDLAALQHESESATTTALGDERHAAGRSALWLVSTGLLALAVVSIGTTVVARMAARRVAEAAAREQELSESVATNDFEGRLQRALDLAPNERRVYDVVRRALHEAVPAMGVELLLADSSRAHFHQLVTSGELGSHRCSVESPVDCPAAQSGSVMTFPSSRALDACPYLQDQPGPCSAVCVPLSVNGTTVGVVHADGPDGVRPGRTQVVGLELVGRRTSDRIGMLRSFIRSEVQANTDPLTGLPNRRALEDQVNRLDLAGVPYAVAFGDLDHFKLLNDVHGHSAGDQALRLFSRTVRAALRPDDLVGRYGGEEFVVVLPEVDQQRAIEVLERIRSHLATEIVQSGAPSFTVSFGLASPQAGQPFEALVSVADTALLRAKKLGRNRVVVAGTDAVAEGARPIGDGRVATDLRGKGLSQYPAGVTRPA